MTDRTFFLWNLNVIGESLPISSSGHLRLLTQHLSHQGTPIFIDTITEHLMHIPNALIIVTFLIINTHHHLTFSLPAIILYSIAFSIVNIVTGLAYLTLQKKVKQFPLALGFLFSALSLFSLYWAPVNSSTTILPLQALIIGCSQTLALLPGISRMALTTTTGIWLGIHPGVSFLFSLVCEFGLMCIAIAVALYKTNVSWRLSSKQLVIIGCSTLVSYAALELSYISFLSGSAVFFGWYLLAVSIYAKFYQRK